VSCRSRARTVPSNWSNATSPEPGAGSVRVKVEACGICHSDSFTKEGTWPGHSVPACPGTRDRGTIDASGTGVAGWRRGQRVGVGCTADTAGTAIPAVSGDFVTCQIAPRVPGISMTRVRRIRDRSRRHVDSDPGSAFTRRCGAADVCRNHHFNSLRNSGRAARRHGRCPRGGWARAFGHPVRREDGFRTFAIARGRDKEPLARKLGASIHRQSGGDPAAELVKLGGARVISQP